MYSFDFRPCCPVCTETAIEELYVEPFISGSTGEFIREYYSDSIDFSHIGDALYVLSRCTACTLIFQRFVLGEEGLIFLYERAIDPIVSLAKRTSADDSYTIGLLADSGFVKNFFVDKRAEQLDVLDFGMGWGHWCLSAKNHGYNVFGAELSDNRKNFALENGVQIYSPLDEDSNQLFDFINIDQVLEHLTEPFFILNLLRSKLKKGGVMKVSVPNASADYRRFKAGKWLPGKDAFHPLEHVNGFNRSSIDSLVKRAGLRPLTLIEMIQARGLRSLATWIRRGMGNPNWYFKRD